MKCARTAKKKANDFTKDGSKSVARIQSARADRAEEAVGTTGTVAGTWQQAAQTIAKAEGGMPVFDSVIMPPSFVQLNDPESLKMIREIHIL